MTQISVIDIQQSETDGDRHDIYPNTKSSSSPIIPTLSQISIVFGDLRGHDLETKANTHDCKRVQVPVVSQSELVRG